MTFYVAGFAYSDPLDERGRDTKRYSRTLMAPEAAVADFLKLVASGKYEYVVVEYMDETTEPQTTSKD